ncbi:unnamed protein product [Spodoptera exigua]|nr:unnamed protein product [Spodoptera exigua]
MNLEKEWIIRISMGLIGALTHGLSVTPHALLHIGLDLERFILDRLVRVEATGFGTALRAKIADTYRAFSCYGMVTPLRNTYYRRMAEHSMLTEGQNAHAFLILDAKIEIDNFDLIMRDRALLLGFRQLLKVPDEVKKMAPLNIPGPHESNPSTTFRRILMASSTKPQVISKPVEASTSMTFWKECRDRYTLKRASSDKSTSIKATITKPVQIKDHLDLLIGKSRTVTYLSVYNKNYHEETFKRMKTPPGTLLISNSSVTCPEHDVNAFLVDMRSMSSSTCNKIPYLSSIGRTWISTRGGTTWVGVTMLDANLTVLTHQATLFPDRAMESCKLTERNLALHRLNETAWISITTKGHPMTLADLFDE